jgi:hypothetical protein
MDSDDKFFRWVYRKVQNFRKHVGIEEMTMKNISTSGMTYYLRKGMESTGLGLKEFLLTEDGANLMDKYNAEKDSLKKDSWGYVKTNSLKAWLKKNDPWGIVDTHFHYGNYSFGGHEYSDFGSKTPRPIWGSSEFTPYYDEEGRIVDLWFHDVLNEKWNLEMKYFYDHDTKTQKAKQIKEL